MRSRCCSGGVLTGHADSVEDGAGWHRVWCKQLTTRKPLVPLHSGVQITASLCLESHGLWGWPLVCDKKHQSPLSTATPVRVSSGVHSPHMLRSPD